MGVNNRQRRAAKARKNRHAAHRGPTPPRADRFREFDPFPDSGQSWDSDAFRVGAASLALRHLALRRVRGHSLMPDAEEVFGRCPAEVQQRALDDQLAQSVGLLFGHGWTPADLHAAARRRLDAATAEHLMCVVAQQSAGRGAVHPDWAAQVAALCTVVDGGSRAWAARLGPDWPQACHRLVELVVLLVSLPTLDAVLPAPGTAASAAGVASAGVDERVLRKVRALLAKAEATEFDDEAEALTAKAQHLMTTHSIERALADDGQRARSRPMVRRIWLDAPYPTAKAMIIGAVAASNSCVCVLSKEWGFVTVVGHAGDLDTVELLGTSLLVQATRAMTASGSHATRYGTSRTRSFRQSFLLAYAGRIGERLDAATTDAEQTADTAHGGGLLPVLAARADQVRAVAGELFPHTTPTSVRISDAAGWGAGRAAADLALFDIHDAVGQAAG